MAAGAEKNLRPTELYALLRYELGLRGWTRRHFARLLGLRESTVGRWLSPDPKARVLPRPATVTHIARVLDMDPAYLLRAAGYLGSPATVPFVPESPLDEQLRVRARRFRRLLHMVLPRQMPLALLLIDAMLDGLQGLISRLEDEETDDDEPTVT